MPKKKATGLKHIHFRLKPDEAAAIEADRKALPGVPVAASAYAKHAVMSYARLRQIENHLQSEAGNPNSAAHQIAKGILAVYR
jgi:hypothetical protein